MTAPAVIRSYADLVDTLRARADELGATRLQIDDAAGLHEGYASKLLTKTTIRALGRVSLGPMLQALGIALVAIDDPQALARIEGQYGRKRPVHTLTQEQERWPVNQVD